MQHQAVSLALYIPLSPSRSLSRSCNTSIKTQFSCACAAHAAGGKWQRQLAIPSYLHLALFLAHLLVRAILRAIFTSATASFEPFAKLPRI